MQHSMHFNSIAAVQQRMAIIQAEISDLQAIKRNLENATIYVHIEHENGKNYVFGQMPGTGNWIQMAGVVSMLNTAIDQLQAEYTRMKDLARTFQN